MHKDLNYQLGIYVGEYIVSHKLLTLSTDMLKSNCIIEVSVEDKLKHTEIRQSLNKTYKFEGGDGNSSEKFEVYKNFNHELAKKYLPKKINCLVPKVYISDMGLFKKGIDTSLWDSDLCWYKIVDDFYKSTNGWADYVFLELNVK